MKKLLLGLIFSSFIGLAVAGDDDSSGTPSPSAAPTPPTALVTKLRGTVLFGGIQLKEGDIIDKVGKIETKNKSYLQVKVDKWKNFISIGPNSVMELNFADDKKYTLEEGTCRWKGFGESASKGKIFTKRVALGVRGTDFFLKYTPVLDETEVVMFDGEVKMDNLKDANNTAVIKKGQWGGIGGRFGEKIGNILDLPQSLLVNFEKALE
ncbi:MAG: hypothetical protein WC635_04720 [Bacteriovorax sp.]|jgi:hypothetical protein